MLGQFDPWGNVMLSAVRSASVVAATGTPVTVEAHIGLGLPVFTILGRPDDVCRESEIASELQF